MSARKTQKDKEAAKPKKEKAVFDLPGQLREPPEENEPLRIFYESLYNQRPDSEMAQIWMMEHGLLDEDEARRVLVIKQKRGSGRSAAANPASARAATAVRASSAAASAAASRASATAPSSRSGSAAGGKASGSAAKVEPSGGGRSVGPSSNGTARAGAKAPTSGGRKAAVKSYNDESESEEEVIPLKKLRR